MAVDATGMRQHGNSYNIFILVLTVFSLAIMVLLLLPVTQAEHDLLMLYDNAVCVVFLVDFAFNLLGSKPKIGLLHQGSWLAGPARVHPDHRRLPVRRPVPACPAEPADADHEAAARPGRQGPGP